MPQSAPAIFGFDANVNTLLNPDAITPAWIEAIQKAANDATYHGITLYPRRRIPSDLLYISDNGGDVADLAASEIKSRLSAIRRTFLKLGVEFSADVDYCDIPSQDWRAGAFDLAQLKNDSIDPSGKIMMLNCAPRLQQRGREANNKGEPLYIGIDARRTIVLATSAHSFGFLRDEIASGALRVYPIHMDTGGSQFRSRDIFPWVSMLVTELSHFMPHEPLFETLKFLDRANPLTADRVPDLSAQPEAVRIDVHGNVKLSKRYSEFADAFAGYAGDLYAVVNGHALKCRIKDNSFDSSDGNTGISNGSSGKWMDKGTDKNGFAELFTVGGRASDALALNSVVMKNGGVSLGRKQIEVHLVRGDLIERYAHASQISDPYEQVAVHIVEQGLVRYFDNRKLQELVLKK